MVSIVVVESLPKAHDVCEKLKKLTVIAVDIEGINISNGGTVSLVQIAASSHEVYLFDILALGNMVFTQAYLQPIFRDPNILKLCYDCRCDCAALRELTHGDVCSFYDLQVVYTTLYQVLFAIVDSRLWRAADFMPRRTPATRI